MRICAAMVSGVRLLDAIAMLIPRARPCNKEAALLGMAPHILGKSLRTSARIGFSRGCRGDAVLQGVLQPSVLRLASAWSKKTSKQDVGKPSGELLDRLACARVHTTKTH